MGEDTVVLVASKKRVPWQEAAALFGVTKIRQRFGSWAVTNNRVACLTFPYDIPADDIHRTHGSSWSWEKHLGEKGWVVQADLLAALTLARRVFPPRPQKRRTRSVRRSRSVRAVAAQVRFLILRRDAYRCRLCGVTADEGARLHVDHRIPVIAGGASTMENLWTLCADCNLGKGRLSL